MDGAHARGARGQPPSRAVELQTALRAPGATACWGCLEDEAVPRGLSKGGRAKTDASIIHWTTPRVSGSLFSIRGTPGQES